jgi:hypothetical protein
MIDAMGANSHSPTNQGNSFIHEYFFGLHAVGVLGVVANITEDDDGLGSVCFPAALALRLVLSCASDPLLFCAAHLEGSSTFLD